MVMHARKQGGNSGLGVGVSGGWRGGKKQWTRIEPELFSRTPQAVSTKERVWVAKNFEDKTRRLEAVKKMEEGIKPNQGKSNLIKPKKVIIRVKSVKKR